MVRPIGTQLLPSEGTKVPKPFRLAVLSCAKEFAVSCPATVASSPSQLAQIPTLLRGEPGPILLWIGEWRASRVALYVAVIIAGTATFGWALGAWRDPLQGLYTAIKFPLIVLLTALGNGLLNGMLAPLLGTNISFRQSLLAVLMSFTIAAAVLGACGPLIYFVVWNAPAFSPDAQGPTLMMHNLIFLALVAAMAVAGLAGNARLFELLRQLSGQDGAARRTLFAWLAGNLLLGSQLAWILRPLVGSPSLPVEFLRANAFDGNFFESTFYHARHLFP